MAAAAAGLLAACAATEPMKPAAAPAAEAAAPSAGNDIKGKIVWVDLKNSALLVVCEDDAGCKSVQGKKGETYTLVIPESMKKSAGAWKEGGLVSVVFEDRADGGRTVKSVSGP
jgi:hypothetical protein